MDCERLEELGITQRRHDGALERRGQIDLSRCPVAKLQPDLLQGRDPLERLSAAGPLPVLEQFSLVEAGPFKHEPQRPGREGALKDGVLSDVDRRFVDAVHRVEMRHAVLGRGRQDARLLPERGANQVAAMRRSVASGGKESPSSSDSIATSTVRGSTSMYGDEAAVRSHNGHGPKPSSTTTRPRAR